MPKPRENESREKFISRCVPIVVEEGKPQKQAVAICHSIWREDKGGKMTNNRFSIINGSWDSDKH